MPERDSTLDSSQVAYELSGSSPACIMSERSSRQIRNIDRREKGTVAAWMIEAEKLTRKFGDLTAVDNVTFKVNQGEIFGFLGPNGAGKTTTVRMLCCLISKTSGEARIAGYEVGNGADSLKIREVIGLVPDNVGLYDELSAYDNLDFYGKLYDCSEAKRKESI